MADSIRIAILGLGNVGRALARAAAGHGLDVGAAADSSGGILVRQPDGLDALVRLKESGAEFREHRENPFEPDLCAFIHSLRPAGISVLVECLPTNLRDGQPGIRLIDLSLSAGLHVVTVDKGPPAFALEALEQAATSAGVRLAYSGATGVRLPCDLRGGSVLEIRGVLNGTTNYVLSRMREDSLPFGDALALAQAQGIAEPDPARDVEGWDTACKILILAKACMQARATPGDVARTGIGPATETLIAAARKSGRVVRLIGRARRHQGRVRVSVAPKLVGPDSPFFAVSGTSKAALFRAADGSEVLVSARSGRDEIVRTIVEDVFEAASHAPGRIHGA
jgi:homoserine dehydrogenase